MIHEKKKNRDPKKKQQETMKKKVHGAEKIQKTRKQKEHRRDRSANPKTEKKHIGRRSSIRGKIFICFTIPLLFLIFLGVTSYKRASDGLNETYQNASLQTVVMSSEYMEQEEAFIEAEALKYLSDSTLTSYFHGKLEKVQSEKRVLQGNVRKRIIASKIGNDFISDIYIMTKPGVTVIYDSNVVKDGINDKTEEERQQTAGKNNQSWTDRHDTLDEYLGIDPESYILSYTLASSREKGSIIIDVKKTRVQEFLSELDMGEGSIVGYITANGREILSGAEAGEEKTFYGQEFFEKAREKDQKILEENKKQKEGEPTETPGGCEQVTYQGKSYVYMHCLSEKSEATICALVPMESITQKANSIGKMTAISVIIGTTVAVTFGMATAAGIRKNMKSISQNMKMVAQGNLTAQVKAYGNDEFRELAATTNDMIAHTKKLVQHVDRATNTLADSTKEVTEASGMIQDSSKQIAEAIVEINSGMEKQSLHAQECVDKTGSLSDKMQDVTRVAQKVEELVGHAEGMIRDGMELIRVLQQRAEETTQSTDQVKENIEELKKESETIEQFIRMITDIAEQTNLLSLNASIEAARAGESGRGFAVVAEQIRNLASSSAEAAEEIRQNVSHINTQTNISVTSVEQAHEMVRLQTEAVDQMTDVFRQMNEAMEELFLSIKDILSSSELADQERAGTLEAVRNISEIIERTAVATEQVSNIAEGLKENVQTLNQTADSLEENMDGLKAEVAVFKTQE